MRNISAIACEIKRDWLKPNYAAGNPRYYFPHYVWPKMDDKVRRNTGFLSLYRGKRYGAGYVMTSYNLDSDIEYALRAILNKN